MCFNDRCGHGKCIEKTNTFTCVCTTGWTGKYCKKGYYNRLNSYIIFYLTFEFILNMWNKYNTNNKWDYTKLFLII